MIAPSNKTDIPPLVIFAVLDMCVIETGLLVFAMLGVLAFELLVDMVVVVWLLGAGVCVVFDVVVVGFDVVDVLLFFMLVGDDVVDPGAVGDGLGVGLGDGVGDGLGDGDDGGVGDETVILPLPFMQPVLGQVP